jgi:succinyl-CoA synthetase beta subunit
MARQPISEFRAKTVLSAALGQPYGGLPLDAQDKWQTELADLDPKLRYVVKVDEGVKGRFKKGLVELNVPAAEVPATAQKLFNKGYRYGLVEAYQPHEPSSERYLMANRTREGIVLMFNEHGGVEVESRTDTMKQAVYSPKTAASLETAHGLPTGSLSCLMTVFDEAYFGFVELNPFVLHQGRLQLLDAAVEVDDAAATLSGGRWSLSDIRVHHQLTSQEQAVAELAASSQSSFNLQVLNPNGAVFLLLSGGGASVTLADEVHNQGWGQELANYGEYSGNPTADETYVYTQQILSLLLASRASSKVLVIAGGVANFTDIRVTFSGVIRALKAVEKDLVTQRVKVFVRRGGPYQAEGLAAIQAYLAHAGLLGEVAGPELLLSEIIPLALKDLKGKK